MNNAGKTSNKGKHYNVCTEQQKVQLGQAYLFNQYITSEQKAELAASTGLSISKVTRWFETRRANELKRQRKRDEVTQVAN